MPTQTAPHAFGIMFVDLGMHSMSQQRLIMQVFMVVAQVCSSLTRRLAAMNAPYECPPTATFDVSTTPLLSAS